MRIATGCIGHETNTFSPVATRFDNFKDDNFHIGDEVVAAFAGTSTIIGGFLEGAEAVGIEVVPLLWTLPRRRGR